MWIVNCQIDDFNAVAKLVVPIMQMIECGRRLYDADGSPIDEPPALNLMRLGRMTHEMYVARGSISLSLKNGYNSDLVMLSLIGAINNCFYPIDNGKCHCREVTSSGTVMNVTKSVTPCNMSSYDKRVHARMFVNGSQKTDEYRAFTWKMRFIRPNIMFGTEVSYCGGVHANNLIIINEVSGRSNVVEVRDNKAQIIELLAESNKMLAGVVKLDDEKHDDTTPDSDLHDDKTSDSDDDLHDDSTSDSSHGSWGNVNTNYNIDDWVNHYNNPTRWIQVIGLMQCINNGTPFLETK
jgi:hypothetical protein